MKSSKAKKTTPAYRRPAHQWVGIFSQCSGVSLMLMMGLLLSALLVLYAKDRQRCLLIQHQRLTQQFIHMQAEKGRLLLEAGALSNQQQVQTIAQRELQMHLPTVREVVLLRTVS
jgi:cell division protein FtsL